MSQSVPEKNFVFPSSPNYCSDWSPTGPCHHEERSLPEEKAIVCCSPPSPCYHTGFSDDEDDKATDIDSEKDRGKQKPVVFTINLRRRKRKRTTEKEHPWTKKKLTKEEKQKQFGTSSEETLTEIKEQMNDGKLLLLNKKNKPYKTRLHSTTVKDLGDMVDLSQVNQLSQKKLQLLLIRVAKHFNQQVKYPSQQKTFQSKIALCESLIRALSHAK
jgi:hypothetical protein